MKRSSSRNASDRVVISVARGTIESVNDQPMMQEITVKLFHDEQADTIEQFHPYGFTANPQPPQDKKKAETVVIFPNGNRSHALAIITGDRRFRPKNSKSGEVIVHDDQGQQVYLTRTGINITGGPSKLPVTVTVGNAVVTVADGKITSQVGGNSGAAVVVKSGDVHLGGDPDHGGSYALVETVSGPSSNVYAKL